MTTIDPEIDASGTNGFPEGCFIIRSATNRSRVFDVAGSATHDGAKLILWTIKESSLVESRRDPSANNQVFFIDDSGALCCKSSGHAVDIEGDNLVLRRRRPLTRPYPNRLSHPLPNFFYSPETKEITVAFLCDPRFHASSACRGGSNQIHLLTSKPKRRDPNLFDTASNFLNDTLTASVSLFGGQAKISAEPGALAAIGAELSEDEILPEDQGEEAEVDDSPDPMREICMISIKKRTEDDQGLVAKARTRRKWLVEAISATDARTGSRHRH
ncbi:hypothetical protein E1B28_001546 [Marasmius oreades]|uniref:Uncharacterized protein n=1 Tax=Marasmius oreades TaxID=181124 RepID=A0A9P7V3M2_9AGAR|nr:uncharacterized protein E1B28_001546 [Marasmius oreades]KAG7099729.1 hypothetical protein E1B28_001546 [Marasmius oreades]